MALAPAIALAGLGSFGLAGGSVLQHRSATASTQSDSTRSASTHQDSGRPAATPTSQSHATTMTRRQLAAMIRRPAWLAGMLAVVVATLLNLAALRLAPVTVIQPLGVMAVVWSVLLAPSGAGRRRGHSGSRRTGATWASVALILAGLIGFTVFSTTTTTTPAAIPGVTPVLAGAAISCLVGATLTATHRLAPAGLRCLALGASGAVFYGLTATLVRLGFSLLSAGDALTSTSVITTAAGALAACLVGGVIVQQAYALGHAEIVVAALTTIDPIVAATLGLTVLGEGCSETALSIAAMAVCGLLAAAGVAALSRARSHKQPTPPTPGPATHPAAYRTALSDSAPDDDPTHPHSAHRPRIALVSDYTMATLGGAESAFGEQARALAASADVLIACPASPALAALGRHPGITAFPVPVALTLPGLGLPVARNTARLRAALRNAFIAHRIDAVHVHSEFGIAAAAIDVAHELGIPAAETVHTFFWQAPAAAQPLLRLVGPRFHRLVTGYAGTTAQLARLSGDSALRNMTLTVAQHADHVISPSAHQAEHLRDAGLTRVDVVPNTVAEAPDARPVTTIDGPLRVLWTGRFAPEKRVLPFLAAAIEALDVVGPGLLRIDLLGTGPQFCAAARLVDDRPGIHLHGRVPHDDIPRWLARSHCSVLSSLGWDNQPMTVAESVTALRGVIWCDPALTEGVDRAGIPAFGPNGLTRRLIGLAVDPAPVLDASAAAVEARRPFGRDRFARSVLDVYRLAAGNPRLRPTLITESPA